MPLLVPLASGCCGWQLPGRVLHVEGLLGTHTAPHIPTWGLEAVSAEAVCAQPALWSARAWGSQPGLTPPQKAPVSRCALAGLTLPALPRLVVPPRVYHQRAQHQQRDHDARARRGAHAGQLPGLHHPGLCVHRQGPMDVGHQPAAVLREPGSGPGCCCPCMPPLPACLCLRALRGRASQPCLASGVRHSQSWGCPQRLASTSIFPPPPAVPLSRSCAAFG